MEAFLAAGRHTVQTNANPFLLKTNFISAVLCSTNTFTIPGFY
jgi:hypothetical protein